jgi:hypothetical protein
MSYFKDFSEIPPTYRGSLSMLLGAPFWYLSIYLFDAHLYKQDDVLKFVFCLCISLVSNLFLHIYCVAIESTKINIKQKRDGIIVEQMEVDASMYYSSVKYVLSLCIQMFIFYSLKHFFNFMLSYYQYVLITFWVHIVTIIRFIRLDFQLRKYENNPAT